MGSSYSHLAGCSTSPSSKAAASEGPDAYHLGYVEDPSDARTKLADFFSILLMSSCCAGRLRLLEVSARAVVFRIFRRSRCAILLAEIFRDKDCFEMGREVIEFHGQCFGFGHQKVIAKERGNRDHEPRDRSDQCRRHTWRHSRERGLLGSTDAGKSVHDPPDRPK